MNRSVIAAATGLVVTTTGCAVGLMNPYPKVAGRAREGVILDHPGDLFGRAGDVFTSGNSPFGIQAGAAFGQAYGKVRGMSASGFAVTPRLQLSAILNPWLGVGLSIVNDRQELDVGDQGTGKLAYSGWGGEARVIASPVDAIVLEAGFAEHHGGLQLDQQPSTSVWGHDWVLAGGFTMNYVGLVALVGAELRWTSTGSASFAGESAALDSHSVLARVLLTF